VPGLTEEDQFFLDEAENLIEVSTQIRGAPPGALGGPAAQEMEMQRHCLSEP